MPPPALVTPPRLQRRARPLATPPGGARGRNQLIFVDRRERPAGEGNRPTVQPPLGRATTRFDRHDRVNVKRSAGQSARRQTSLRWGRWRAKARLEHLAL